MWPILGALSSQTSGCLSVCGRASRTWGAHRWEESGTSDTDRGTNYGKLWDLIKGWEHSGGPVHHGTYLSVIFTGRSYFHPSCGIVQGMAHHLEKNIPGCQCTIVPGKGHMAFMDDGVFTKALEWLKAVEKRQS